MILHNYTLRHPLVRGGTQQRDRLLLSLIPGQLQLDNRSIEELIAFAGRLSTHVRHWGPDNKEDGDWQPFWESDTTSLLAILAATDSDTPRTGFRTQEILCRRLLKKEENGTAKEGDQTAASVMEDMIKNTSYGIYGLALTILGICQKTPDDHPLKQDIVNIISSTLQEPLYRLIQFHKAIDPNAIQLYTGFIGATACAVPWGLKDNAAFECINYVIPYEYIDELWNLFLNFYKALSLILEKARKAFQSALRTRHDHEPHIALFFTFLYLFKHLQDELNNMVDKHLLFYYEDVLRLERRQLIPDKVHVVFGIAAKLANHLLTAGTALKAGADSNGKPMTYALNDELVISPAKLVERKNLYLKQVLDANGNQVTTAIALPAADKKDGLQEEWPAGQKAWRALSGETVYNNLMYRYRKINELISRYDYAPTAARTETGKVMQKIQQLQGFSGFSITSTELWLQRGIDRFVVLNFTFDESDSTNLLDTHYVEISTEKGLIRLNAVPELPPGNRNNYGGDEFGLPLEFTGAVKHDYYNQIDSAERWGTPPDESFSLYNRIIRIRDEKDDITIGQKQQYVCWLHPEFPAVLPIDENTPPFIRFRSKESLMDNRSIDNVAIWSAVGGFIQESYDYLRYGILGNIPQPAPEGVFFRQTPLGIESKEMVVLTDGRDTDTYVRYPELFFKNPAMLRLSLMSGQQSAYITNVSFLYRSKWYLSHDTKKYDYTISIDNYQVHDAPLVPDEGFPVSLTDVNNIGWIEILLSMTESATYVLDADNVNVAYKTVPVIIDNSESDAIKLRQHHFSYFNSFGDWEDTSGNVISATPIVTMPQQKLPIGPEMFERERAAQPVANGNLYLGFEQLVPDQTLSLLFKTAPGTGNPDHFAPAVTWSYLTNNEWLALPPQYILKDTTLGMQQTGIILFQIPEDINNGNTAIKGTDGRTDLYWLRASAIEIPDDQVLVDALPMLVDIHVNAAEATFEDNNNTEDHLEAGIPAATITALKYRDVGVKTVTQPYASFNGRFSEEQNETGYITRIHERLRHKDRAVTVWDYERIVLEAFPTIAVIKCLPHSRRYYTARPGHVTLAAIPFPSKMTGDRIFYPTLEAGDLTTIKQFLATRSSYFVSGYGDPGFCCCDDDCECEEGNDRLDIINARFEPVRIKVCVRFYKGKDIPYYTKALNEALKSFLAPWAKDNKPLLFGTTINMTRMLQFLEKLDYVDVVTGLQVKHFPSRDMAEEYESVTRWSNQDEIVPFTAASVLTTYLDKLNADNPNVIDHEINVITTFDKCACGNCGGDDNTGEDDGIREVAAPGRGMNIDPAKIVPKGAIRKTTDTVQPGVTTQPADTKTTATTQPATTKPAAVTQPTDTKNAATTKPAAVTQPTDTKTATTTKPAAAPNPKAATQKNESLPLIRAITPDKQNDLQTQLQDAWNPRAKKPDTILNSMETVLKQAVKDKLLQGEIPDDPAGATADKSAYSIQLVQKEDVVTAVKIGLAFTAGTFTNIQIDKP